MNPNGFGLLCAGAGLAGFYLSYRLSLGIQRKPRVILAVAATLWSLPGASFAVHYLHILPEQAWYFAFRSLRGTELMLIPPGIAGGLVASLLPRKMLLLPLLGAGALILLPIVKPLVGPIPRGAMEDRWDANTCLQSTASTCGPASVATILRSLGVRATEAELAREGYSYLGGTECWYLARAIRRRDCTARFHTGTGLDDAPEFPALAGVRRDGSGHFIAVLSREGDHYRIGDPLLGPETLSRAELLGRYTFTGFFMPIRRSH